MSQTLHLRAKKSGLHQKLLMQPANYFVTLHFRAEYLLSAGKQEMQD